MLGKENIRSLDRGNVFWDIAIHQTMKFISHAWVSIGGGNSRHRSGKAALGIHASLTILRIKGRLGLQSKFSWDNFFTHLNSKQDMMTDTENKNDLNIKS